MERLPKCDMCNKILQYGEVLIVYHNLKTDTFFVECMKCAEDNPDTEMRKNIRWEVHEYGKTISYGRA